MSEDQSIQLEAAEEEDTQENGTEEPSLSPTGNLYRA